MTPDFRMERITENPLSYPAPLLSENPESRIHGMSAIGRLQAGLFRLSPSGKFEYPASTTVAL
ncbi:MAG: hypothetical protein B6245_08535 [Desulfobacteraceae bacterium 4572_88]|nr:MAG: hypothetical protein B6245_08535 [Desulfobacteraceae bacterium 4572_88]